MDDSTLDTLLRRSAPAALADHPAVEANVLALVGETDAAARPARRLRRALRFAAIPAVPLLALALSAGVEERLVPDLTIPVSYVTDTGVPVSCSIFVFNGEVNWVEESFAAVDYLKAREWSGIGQRIYAQALIEETEVARLARTDEAVWSVDGVNPPDAATIEQIAWSIAESKLIDGSVPAQPGDHWGGDSDCSGQLH